MKVEEKTIKLYNKIVKTYHERITKGKKFHNTYLEGPIMLKLIGNVKGKRILDLGCGSGKYSRILFKKGGKITGIDINPEFISLAKKEVPKAKFYVASTYKLPFKSNCFDMIVAGLVVEHFDKLDKAFKEIRRVLKKNGVFIFSLGTPLLFAEDPNKNYFREGKAFKYWPRFGIKMIYFHYTFETWIKTILKHGFEIIGFAESKPAAFTKKLFPKDYRKTSKKPIFCAFKVKKK